MSKSLAFLLLGPLIFFIVQICLVLECPRHCRQIFTAQNLPTHLSSSTWTATGTTVIHARSCFFSFTLCWISQQRRYYMWTTPVLGAERGLPVFCLKSRREILRSILRWTEYPVERNLVFEPVTVWFFRERRDVALKAPNWTMVESDSSTGENTCLVSRSFCHPKVAIVTNIPAVPLFLYAFLFEEPWLQFVGLETKQDSPYRPAPP